MAGLFSPGHGLRVVIHCETHWMQSERSLCCAGFGVQRMKAFRKKKQLLLKFI